MKRLLALAASLIELCKVAWIMPRIEALRCSVGLKPLLETLRASSGNRRMRGPHGRIHLRRAIAWLDARMPGGGNCYRRVLVEMALDGGAAAEAFFMGFNLQNEKLDGHAWLADRSGGSDPFQVVIQL